MENAILKNELTLELEKQQEIKDLFEEYNETENEVEKLDIKARMKSLTGLNEELDILFEKNELSADNVISAFNEKKELIIKYKELVGPTEGLEEFNSEELNNLVNQVQKANEQHVDKVISEVEKQPIDIEIKEPEAQDSKKDLDGQEFGRAPKKVEESLYEKQILSEEEAKKKYVLDLKTKKAPRGYDNDENKGDNKKVLKKKKPVIKKKVKLKPRPKEESAEEKFANSIIKKLDELTSSDNIGDHDEVAKLIKTLDGEQAALVQSKLPKDLEQRLNDIDAPELMEWPEAKENNGVDGKFDPKEPIETDESSKMDWPEEKFAQEKSSEDEEANFEVASVFEMKDKERQESVDMAFESSLNIKPEDLEKIEGFVDLSEGQKLLVLRNLKQINLGRIKDDSFEEHEAGNKKVNFKKNFFGAIKDSASNIVHGMKKAFNIAKLEKLKAEELEQGGLETHKELLEELTKMVGKGPDVVRKDGKLELQYITGEENFSKEEKEQVAKFNSIANEFASISREDTYDEAGKKGKEQYNKIKEAYSKARNETLNLVSEKKGEKEAFVSMNQIDADVSMNQFFDQNKDVELELSKMADQNTIVKGLKDLGSGKRLAFLAGGILRHISKATIGLAAAPIVGGAIGAIRGRIKGKEKLQKSDSSARKGIKDDSAEAKNVVEISKLNDKIDLLLNKIEEVSQGEYSDIMLGKTRAEISERWDVGNKGTDNEKAKDLDKLVDSLRTRIEYTQGKIERGLVNFGAEKERIGGQYDLLHKMSHAQASLQYHDKKEGELKAEKEKNQDKKSLGERLESFLELKDKNISEKRKEYLFKKTRDGAFLGAGFAVAGWAARNYAPDAFSWVKDKFSPSDVPVVSGVAGVNVADNIKIGQEALDDTLLGRPVLTFEEAVHVSDKADYLGGSSVWEESKNQLEATLGEADEQMVNRMTQFVVREPVRYGLPQNVDFKNMSAEEIKDIDWNKALGDTISNDELPEVEVDDVKVVENNIEKEPEDNLDRPRNEVLKDIEANSEEVEVRDLYNPDGTINYDEYFQTEEGLAEARHLNELADKYYDATHNRANQMPRNLAFEELKKEVGALEEKIGYKISYDKDDNVFVHDNNGRHVVFNAKDDISDSKFALEDGEINFDDYEKAKKFLETKGGMKKINKFSELSKEINEGDLSASQERRLSNRLIKLRAELEEKTGMGFYDEPNGDITVSKDYKYAKIFDGKSGKLIEVDSLKSVDDFTPKSDTASLDFGDVFDEEQSASNELENEEFVEEQPQEVVEEQLVDDENLPAKELSEKLNNNPQEILGEIKPIFAEKYTMLEQENLTKYVNSEIEERNELLKLIDEYKNEYGDRPQFSAFRKMAEGQVGTHNGQISSMLKGFSDSEKDYSAYVSSVGGGNPKAMAESLMERYSRKSGLLSRQELSDKAFDKLKKMASSR